MTKPTHRLGPFLGGLAIATAALLTRHPLALGALLVALWPWSPRPRWPIVLFALGAAAMNGLFSWHGDTVLWRAPFTFSLVGRPRLTLEALALGLATGLQVAVAAYALMAGFARSAPQAVARLVPWAGPRLATTVALRAMPDLVEDARAMRVGLAARGLESQGVRGAANLLVPLVGRGLDRSLATIEVLYARGVGTRPRAALPVSWSLAETLSLAGLLLAVTAWALDAWPSATFFPGLSFGTAADWRTWTPLVALLGLAGVRCRAA